MGAWDATSFGNDTANDWVYDLEECEDLSHIEATLQKVIDVGSNYIEARDAEEAIAAAEVIAWLRGRPTPMNAYTAKVAAWVAAHPINPPTELIQKTLRALDRIRSDASELLELWEGNSDWNESVSNLRVRLTA